MWYDVGTVSVTNGSTTVTGSGTNFIAGAQVGEAFLAPDDKLYEIASITSATVLVLADPYLGSTQSGQDYKIVPTQSLVADLASDVTDLIADYADVKDKAGAGKFNDGSVTSPAITFEQDQNNGLYRIGSDNYAMSAGGTKQIDISTTDVELNYSGSKKLATTSTGVDVTGTVTADGLTVDGDDVLFKRSDTQYFRFYQAAGGQELTTTSGTNKALSIGTTDSNPLRLKTNNTKRLQIANNGDVHFFEDTGTTAKMVWYANEEQLQIDSNNTGAGGWTENVYLKASQYPSLRFWETTGGKVASIGNNGDGSLVLSVNGTTGSVGTNALVVNSSGNVGIGTASPSSALSVATNGGSWTTSSSDGVGINYNSGNANISTYLDNSTLKIGAGVTQKNGLTIYGQTGGNRIQFDVAGSERARLDSSGNLLVGKTTNSVDIAGGLVRSNGQISACADNNWVSSFARNSTDGEIALFRKDGSKVGSIGSAARGASTGIYLDSQSTGTLRINGAEEYAWDGNQFYPYADNSNDLGFPSFRWDDIYATNGAIQTSDRNEKQDIESISDAERLVAQACKGLLRKFRWKDAVEEKGDDARIHFGIIAQDLQDAFSAQGLDAHDYAMFISTTWTDEETGEERTRLGVRYSELLAFIISAI